MARKSIEERLAQIEVQRKLLKPVSANSSAGMMNAARSCSAPLSRTASARTAIASSPSAAGNGCAASRPAS